MRSTTEQQQLSLHTKIPGGVDCSGPPLDDDVAVRFCDEVFLLAMPLELVSSVRRVSSVRLADVWSSPRLFLLKYLLTFNAKRFNRIF